MQRLLHTFLRPLCALALGLAGLSAQAQAFPDRPLRIVVPFPAGGGVDLMARTVGQRLSTQIGQPVIVENRAGAGGTVGAAYVAKSAPDGYTLLVGSPGSMTISAAAGRPLPYDPIRDFTPVSMGTVLTALLVVPTDSPIRNVADLIARAKARPGSLSFASAGVGSSLHLAGEMFMQQAQLDVLHVPFQGNAPALMAVVSGQVSMGFNDTSALSQIQAGRLRAIAVSAPSRMRALPDTPTVAESGLPSYQFVNWYSFHAPAGVPPAIVTRLQQEIARALRAPDVEQTLLAAGMEVAPSSSQELGAFVQKDLDTWTRVIRTGNIKLD